MPIYRVRRHVVLTRDRQTEEVWGIDRPAPGLRTGTSPRFTDEDDPLRRDCCGTVLLKMSDGCWVTWDRIWAWLSDAEAAGYELVSGYKDVSPYSTLILRGP